MKKLILLFSAVSFIFASCTSDADPLPVVEPFDPTVNTSSVLLKKIIDNDGVDIVTTNYNYNGSKLTSITDDTGYRENYTYTGNLITSTQEIDNGVVLTNNTFEYNVNGKLTFFKRFDGDTGDEFVREGYNYNSDGTVTIDHYDIGVFDNNGAPYIYKKEKLFFTNNELSKVESTNYSLISGVQTASGTSTRNFTYDTKNNPFKNVVGFQNLFYGESALLHNGRFSNLLTENRVGNTGSDVYNFTYNSVNFPATSTYSYNTGGNGSIQYFY